MRRSLLKTIAATAVVGVTMALSSVAAWATEATIDFTTLPWNGEGATNGTTGTYTVTNEVGDVFKVSHSGNGNSAVKLNKISNGSAVEAAGRYIGFVADAGDVVTVKAVFSSKNNDCTLYLVGGNSETTYSSTATYNSVHIGSSTDYTSLTEVTAVFDAIDEAGYYYLFAAGNKNPLIRNFSVTNSNITGTRYTTTYDIAAKLIAEDNKVYQNTSGTIAATTKVAASNAPELIADATSGKIGYNKETWAQFTNGAKITIPNVPSGAVITVLLKSGTTATINGTEYTTPYTTTSAGDVELVSTASGGYIKSITVKSTAFPVVTNYTWDFKTSTSYNADNTAYQNKNGIVNSNVANISLFVNAKSGGKFVYANNGNGYIQMRDGATAYIPVYAVGDTVTVNSENANATIGGTTTAKGDVSYKAVAADVTKGYVELIAPNDDYYVYSIALSTTAAPTSSEAVKYYTDGANHYAVSVVTAAQAAASSRLEQVYGKKLVSSDTVYQKVNIGGTPYDATEFGGNADDLLFATKINHPGSDAETNINKITTNLFA